MVAPAANLDKCPWCDQTIPHERFEEIQAEIAETERLRAADAQRELLRRVAEEKAKIQLAAQADVAAAKKAAIEAAAKARGEGKAEAEKAIGAKVVAAEEALRKSERQLATVTAESARVLEERVLQVREALQKAQVEAVNAEKARAFKERQQLDAKLESLQRQLQRQTANELGEGAEINLFEALKAAYPDDQVTRVKKGTAGADIVHRIIHNRRVCGVILYDSKNRDAWRNDYATKLRQDQLAEQADHAVLASRVFPSGARQVCLQDGIIIANPARVLALVEILRQHVVLVHGLRLSGQARDEKSALLYDFITSERCAQIFAEVENLTEGMLDLDVKEKKAHDQVWQKRGTLIRSVQKAHGSLVSAVEQIVGAASPEPLI